MGGILSSRNNAHSVKAKQPLVDNNTVQDKHVKEAKPVKTNKGRYDNKLMRGINVDTYWKNLPPPGCDVYWLYSSYAGSDYYFMSQQDADALERAYQHGGNRCSLSAVDAYVDFPSAKQVSNCGGIRRNVRRLSKQQYQNIQKEYKEFFNSRSNFWCLKCKKYYLLYSPKYQRELDIAFQNGSILSVKINDKYSYTIDPRNYYQFNISTNKKREVSRVYENCNDMIVYGSHFLKFDRAETPSIMEQSNIYSNGGRVTYI